MIRTPAAPARPHPLGPRRRPRPRPDRDARSAPPGREALHRAERVKAETRLLLLGIVFILGFTTVAGRMALVAAGDAGRAARGRRRRADPRAARRHHRPQRRDPRDQPRHRLALHRAVQAWSTRRARRASWCGSSPTSTKRRCSGGSPTGASSSGSSARSRPSSGSWCTTSASPGLLFGPREMRLYPNGAVAAHLLGRRELRARGRAFGGGDRRRRAREGRGRAAARSGADRPRRCGCRSTWPCSRRSSRCWPRAWPR